MRCEAVLNLPPLDATKTAASGEARRGFGGSGGPVPGGARVDWENTNKKGGSSVDLLKQQFIINFKVGVFNSINLSIYIYI